MTLPAALLLLLWQDDPVTLGMQALERKNYPQAVVHFEEALKKTPNDPQVEFQIALSYSLLGNEAEAVKRYRRAIELKADFFEAHQNLGMILLRSSPEQALPHFQAARTGKPDAFGPAFFLGDALLRTGKPAEAEQHLQFAVSKDPKAADAWSALGRAQLQQDKLAEAEASIKKAVELDPAERPSLLTLAEAQEKKGQVDQAISLLKEFPDHIPARLRLAELLSQQKKVSEALPHFEYIVDKEPSLRSIVGLALAYAETGQREKALPLFQKAVLESPDNAVLHMTYGRFLRDSKNFAGAVREFSRVTRDQPNSYEAWSELAGSQYMLGMHDQALTSLDKVRASGKENSGHVFLRAIILDGMKQYKPALDEYQRFLAMSQGKFPDEEFKARQRIRIIQQVLSKR